MEQALPLSAWTVIRRHCLKKNLYHKLLESLIHIHSFNLYDNPIKWFLLLSSVADEGTKAQRLCNLLKIRKL